MRQPLLLVLFKVLTIDSCWAYGSTNFRWTCDLRSQPLVELVWSDRDQTYVLINDTRNESGGNATSGNVSDELNHHGFLRRSLSSQEWHVESAYGNIVSFEDALTVHSLDDRFLQSSSLPTSNNTTTLFLDENTTIPTTILARKCSCWFSAAKVHNNSYYCPYPRTHCGLGAAIGLDGSHVDAQVAAAYHKGPGCLDVTDEQAFAQNIWPIIVVWYLALSLCLLMTRSGRHAIGFCVSRCCCCVGCGRAWNDFQVRQFIRSYNQQYAQQRTTRLVLGQRRANQQAASTRPEAAVTVQRVTTPASQPNPTQFQITVDLPNIHQPQPPTELLLHTTIFHRDSLAANATSNVLNNACEEELDGIDDSAVCAICHGELEEGDRVGKLRCHHLMHIACLKTWIPRRNVCPLCLAADIAIPRQPSSAGQLEQQHEEDSTS